MQELFVGSSIEHTIVRRTREVNGELVLGGGGLGGGGSLGLKHRRPTMATPSNVRIRFPQG